MIWRISVLALTGVLAVALGAASTYAWLEDDDQPASADAAASDQVVAGRQLFQVKGCAACHTLASAGMYEGFSTGPDLSRLPKEAKTRVEGMPADEYVRVSIAAPEAYVVPGYGYFGDDGFFGGMPALALSPSEIEALTTFLLASSPGIELVGISTCTLALCRSISVVRGVRAAAPSSGASLCGVAANEPG